MSQKLTLAIVRAILVDQAGTSDAGSSCMGYVSRHKRRDLSKYETVYEDPEYDQLRTASGVRHEQRVTAGVLTGGSTLETLGGLTAIVLAIVGFSYRPIEMAACATIAIGFALLAQGASIMARWREALRQAQGAKLERNELVEGVSTEVFGGAVGVILGVIALAGVKPEIVLPVAA